MTVVSDRGVSTSETLTIAVDNAAPTVNAGEDFTVNEGSTFTFNGTFNDPGILDTHTVEWDFGDGSAAIAGTLTPSHIYSDNGIYTVTLTVTDNDGAISSDTLSVTVSNVAPSITELDGPIAINEGETATFSAAATDPGDDSLTYVWNFGDGSETVTGTSVEHLFADNGTYTVTLTVTDDDGASTSQTLDVIVSNVAPTVDAGSNITTEEGAGVTFSGGFFDAGTLDTQTVEWDFGNGSEVTTGTLTPNHIYSDNSIYTVTLTVTDNDGGINSDTLTVTVNNVAPTITELNSPLAMNEGDTATFSATATDPGDDSLTYVWNFGDGSETVAGASVEHIFVDNGMYIVTLTVTDEDGASTLQTLDVSVANVAPTIETLDAVGEGDNTGTALFSATAFDPGDDTLTYTWDFGDGSAPTEGQEVRHTYANEGVYAVTLTVTDEAGGIASQTLVANLERRPAPDLLSDFAVIAERNLTLNGGGDYDGDPQVADDDARIYAGRRLTLNKLPTLPILRDESGQPILDEQGKFILVDRAISVGPNFSKLNAPKKSPYGNLIPPQSVEAESVQIPSFTDVLSGEFDRRQIDTATAIAVNPRKPPINNTNDWAQHFPAPGTAEEPTIVRISRGNLTIPNGLDLRNTVIIVENGDINFNGNGQTLENVVLVTNNGNVNLSNIQARDLSVLASRSIQMNGSARFAGQTLLANGSNNGTINFNGATSTTAPEDNLLVISQSRITFNGVADIRGAFLSRGNFTLNGNSSIIGNIWSKQDVTFNGGAEVTYSRIGHDSFPAPTRLRFVFSD